MFFIPAKFRNRVSANLGKYQKIALAQQKSDSSEADTVSLVKHILSDVLGYDKWDELTSEYKIKNTYCDIAIQVNGKVDILVEVKSAGTNLNDSHLRQAIDYGAHHGIKWIILTNGIEWRLVTITLAKNIQHETISTFTYTSLKSRNKADMNCLYLLSREGMSKKSLDTFYEHYKILNAYTVANIVRSDAIVKAIRREVKKYFPSISVQVDQIREILVSEVLKRETVDSDNSRDAAVAIKKAIRKYDRARTK